MEGGPQTRVWSSLSRLSLHVRPGDASPSTNLMGYQGTALKLSSGPFGQDAGCEEGGKRSRKGKRRSKHLSVSSQLVEAGGTKCLQLHPIGQIPCRQESWASTRFCEKTIEGLLAESLSSPAPHVGTAFSRRTPQQHPAGGPDVYRGPWSGGGGQGEIKQTTKASRVGGSPLLNS